MIELNRRYKINEPVFIFADFENGLPHIYKGRICGVVKGNSIYEFIYQVETAKTIFFRFPDTIYKSVDEMKEDLTNLIAE